MTPSTIPSPQFLKKPWGCMVHGTPRSAGSMLPQAVFSLPQTQRCAFAAALKEWVIPYFADLMCDTGTMLVPLLTTLIFY